MAAGKLKVGFIGFGRFAEVRKRYLDEIPEVELVGFFDPAKVGVCEIRKFELLDDLFDACGAVLISVPPRFAPAYVCAALSKGVKVFCEKPAAICADHLQPIEEHLNSTTLLAYGFNHRQHLSVQKMKSLVDSGKMGKLLWMRGRYGKETSRSYIADWRCNRELNGGGILIDQGIHLVDLMSYLSPGFDGAQAVLSDNYLGVPGVEDNGFVTLFSTKTKVAASIHSTVTQWRYLFSLEVFLERGSIILNGLRTNSGNYGEEVLTIKPNGQNEDKIDFEEHTYTENVSWRREMQAFVDCALTEKPYKYATYKDAVATANLIDLIYERAIWL